MNLTVTEQRIVNLLYERGRPTPAVTIAYEALGYVYPVNPASAVGTHISNLRAKGIEIDCVKRLGYHLRSCPPAAPAPCGKRHQKTCARCGATHAETIDTKRSGYIIFHERLAAAGWTRVGLRTESGWLCPECTPAHERERRAAAAASLAAWRARNRERASQEVA